MLQKINFFPNRACIKIYEITNKGSLLLFDSIPIPAPFLSHPGCFIVTLKLFAQIRNQSIMAKGYLFLNTELQNKVCTVFHNLFFIHYHNAKVLFFDLLRQIASYGGQSMNC